MIPPLNETYNTGTSYSDSVSILGCSEDVPYIPLFALYKHAESNFYKVNGDLKIIWHHKFPLNGNYSIGNSYKNLLRAYNTFTNPIMFLNKQGTYFIRKGMVYTSDFEILLVICIDKDKLSNIDKDKPPNAEDFIAIVNKELFSPKHKLIANRLQKDIINLLPTDIIHTLNPNKYCFKVSRIIPNFDTISDMQIHLNSINEKLCLNQRREI